VKEEQVGERQHIAGWVVARAELERSWSQGGLLDTVWLFRSSTAWTMASMARGVRYDDGGEPVAGSATVVAEVFSRLDQVAAHVERTYGAGSWVALLDAGHAHDDELYRAWVPERIGRDFDQASIHNRDLAEAGGYLAARSLPAPGRALPDWRDHALEAMAARVQELGYHLVERREPAAAARGGPNELVGVLVLARYGYQVAAVVRVDGCGEIYVRVANGDEVPGASLEPIPVVEDGGAR
jgi:hypothetical protein